MVRLAGVVADLEILMGQTKVEVWAVHHATSQAAQAAPQEER